MKRRLLFVCSRNQWRSPTGEAIYRKDPRVEVRARGVSPKARQRLTAADLAWADLVLVMEKEHRARMCRQFQDAMEEVEIVVLDIPDDYGYMDPELEEMLREHVEALLG